MAKTYKAIGFMSGTSMDGLDVALIITDGENCLSRVGGMSKPYEEQIKTRILQAVSHVKAASETEWPYDSAAEMPAEIKSLQDDLVEAHALLAQEFLNAQKTDLSEIDLIGYHGQTLIHQPEIGFTFQLGDGAALARKTATLVVNDLRLNDMKKGGQGAPLAPIYHCCLLHNARKQNRLEQGSHVFVNIGGVSNVSYFDEEGDILAFDTGPGNALLDDWVMEKSGQTCDWGGALALSGIADEAWCEVFLNHPYFDERPPKSIDRDLFSGALASLREKGVSLEDGAATLARLTARSIAKAVKFFDVRPQNWIIGGGGRHNKAIIKALEDDLSTPVIPSEELGIDGDLIEAECFAYLAVRAIKKLPITFPGTTGVSAPLSGGTIHGA